MANLSFESALALLRVPGLHQDLKVPNLKCLSSPMLPSEMKLAISEVEKRHQPGVHSLGMEKSAFLGLLSYHGETVSRETDRERIENKIAGEVWGLPIFALDRSELPPDRLVIIARDRAALKIGIGVVLFCPKCKGTGNIGIFSSVRCPYCLEA